MVFKSIIPSLFFESFTEWWEKVGYFVIIFDNMEATWNYLTTRVRTTNKYVYNYVLYTLIIYTETRREKKIMRVYSEVVMKNR